MSNHSIEIEEYNQSLIHICKCENENCKSSKCNRIRKIIDHVDVCRIVVKHNCPICVQLIKICLHHAKHCRDASCTIPLCSRMKLFIMDQQLKDRIERARLRRLRLVEIMRLPVDQRASKRSCGAL